jgi:hypothetical protein
MAYEWIVNAFESIKEFFVEILDFFEELPDVIEKSLSSFFKDIKGILEMIDPTEKLNSIDNSMKGFEEDLKNFGSGVYDKVKNGIDNVIPRI